MIVWIYYVNKKCRRLSADLCRTIFERQNEYIYIPDLRPEAMGTTFEPLSGSKALPISKLVASKVVAESSLTFRVR